MTTSLGVLPELQPPNVSSARALKGGRGSEEEERQGPYLRGHNMAKV